MKILIKKSKLNNLSLIYTNSLSFYINILSYYTIIIFNEKYSMVYIDSLRKDSNLWKSFSEYRFKKN